MSTTEPVKKMSCPASPRSAFYAPTVYPVNYNSNYYTLTYDVSVNATPTAQSVQSEPGLCPREKFDVMDAAATLSDVTCKLTDVIFKMAAASPEQSRPCLPFIGQILERCEMFVAVHQHMEDNRSESDTSCSVMSTSASTSTSSQATTIFIDNLTDFISSAAPSGVFSRRRSKRRHAKRLRSLVHPELFAVWSHAPQIFSPTKPTPPPKPKLLPTVSLKDVNSRAIVNGPKPYPYPIQSCSNDVKFYKEGLHSKAAPFGSLFGYRTNLGIVTVPDQPVYGYVWNHEVGDWLLHAHQKEDSSWKPRPTSSSRGREKG